MQLDLAIAAARSPKAARTLLKLHAQAIARLKPATPASVKKARPRWASCARAAAKAAR